MRSMTQRPSAPSMQPRRSCFLLFIDYDESLHRLGGSIAAGVKNRDGLTHLPAGVPVLTPEELDDTIRSIPFIVPLFTPAHRMTAAAEAQALGLAPAEPLFDPTSVIPRRTNFGVASYVNAGCCLGSGSRFGAFVTVNRGVTIGHDASFGDFVSTSPGAVVAGNATVGRGAMLGAGCTIAPSVTIGDNAIVGAGAVVLRDVPADCLVLGNPARVVRSAPPEGR
jgi:sugar O-acyltransferase (sialic acid O-acetyltransferase NeuD family)